MTGMPPRSLRSTYRHGDLRRALIEAGTELARRGGPDAVVLREATRRAGVVPNAAYRHFAGREGLLQAVRSAALSALAVSMETELSALSLDATGGDAAAFARASVRAVGTGYLRFAQTETGLFRTAFSAEDAAHRAGDPERAGRTGMNPFELLGLALDRLVEAGLMPAARRPGAEYIAWSAVHGLAWLIIDGPLHRLSAAQAEALGQRVLDMVEQGL